MGASWGHAQVFPVHTVSLRQGRAAAVAGVLGECGPGIVSYLNASTEVLNKTYKASCAAREMICTKRMLMLLFRI